MVSKATTKQKRQCAAETSIEVAAVVRRKTRPTETSRKAADSERKKTKQKGNAAGAAGIKKAERYTKRNVKKQDSLIAPSNKTQARPLVSRKLQKSNLASSNSGRKRQRVVLREARDPAPSNSRDTRIISGFNAGNKKPSRGRPVHPGIVAGLHEEREPAPTTEDTAWDELTSCKGKTLVKSIESCSVGKGLYSTPSSVINCPRGSKRGENSQSRIREEDPPTPGRFARIDMTGTAHGTGTAISATRRFDPLQEHHHLRLKEPPEQPLPKAQGVEIALSTDNKSVTPSTDLGGVKSTRWQIWRRSQHKTGENVGTFDSRRSTKARLGEWLRRQTNAFRKQKPLQVEIHETKRSRDSENDGKEIIETPSKDVLSNTEIYEKFFSQDSQSMDSDGEYEFEDYIDYLILGETGMTRKQRKKQEKEEREKNEANLIRTSSSWFWNWADPEEEEEEEPEPVPAFLKVVEDEINHFKETNMNDEAKVPVEEIEINLDSVSTASVGLNPLPPERLEADPHYVPFQTDRDRDEVSVASSVSESLGTHYSQGLMRRKTPEDLIKEDPFRRLLEPSKAKKAIGMSTDWSDWSWANTVDTIEQNVNELTLENVEDFNDGHQMKLQRAKNWHLQRPKKPRSDFVQQNQRRRYDENALYTMPSDYHDYGSRNDEKYTEYELPSVCYSRDAERDRKKKAKKVLASFREKAETLGLTKVALLEALKETLESEEDALPHSRKMPLLLHQRSFKSLKSF